MTACFDYPEKARLKRIVPKAKIYDAIGASAALKDRFVREVDQITWAYKLAPETINLNPTKGVPELQVFHITAKGHEVHDDVFKAIDRAIPFPIIFEVLSEGQRQVVAARKRPSEADHTKWVVSDHLRGPWVSEEAVRAPLPFALNLGRLYEQILTALMPLEADAEEDIEERLARLDEIRAKERDIERLKSKLKRETQFNIKMTLHGELSEAQAEFEQLKKPR